MTETPAGYRPVHASRTFCGNCGSQSGRASEETLSIRRALSFAEHRTGRFRAANVAGDGSVIEYTVKTLKRDDRLNDDDTEMFRQATTLGIRHARRDHEQEETARESPSMSRV